MKDDRILLRIIIVWLLLALYVMLHEGGHALSALAFGGEITYFRVSLFDARIRHISDLTELQASVLHISGMAMPYLVWVAFLVLAPARTGNTVLSYVKVYSVMVLGTMLPWFFIPLFAAFGGASISDDVTKFLHASGIHPLALSLMFAVLIAASLMLWLRKSPDLLKIIKLQDPPLSVGRRLLAGLIACSLLSVLLMSFPWVGNTEMRGGAGQVVTEADLSMFRDGYNELATIFIEPGRKNQLFEVRFADASAELLKLLLVGLPGDTITLIEYRVFSVGTSRQTQAVEVHPGTYKLILQSEQAAGRMIVAQ